MFFGPQKCAQKWVYLRKLTRFDQIWSDLSRLDQIWSDFTRFGHISPRFDRLINSAQIWPILIRSVLFGFHHRLSHFMHFLTFQYIFWSDFTRFDFLFFISDATKSNSEFIRYDQVVKLSQIWPNLVTSDEQITSCEIWPNLLNFRGIHIYILEQS